MTDQLQASEAFLDWLRSSGGTFYPSLILRNDDTTGLSVFSTANIPSEETLVSSPPHLAITPELSTRAIHDVTGTDEEAMDEWNERMRICPYISLHWAIPERPAALAHGPYVDSLPPASSLLTPLQFTPPELEFLRGTNLAGAVEDRRREWQTESEVVRDVLGMDGLTWDRYLTAATYLSSRAFPSKLLQLSRIVSSSGMDTFDEGEESHPVLLPGIDLFNHARGQPITWLSSPSSISLVSSTTTSAGQQVFNNYGPKSNEELLLAYGFVLDPNPDDTVGLRLGTTHILGPMQTRLREKGLDAGKRFELGKDGVVDEGLVEVMRVMMAHTAEEEEEEGIDEDAERERRDRNVERDLEVLGALGQMMEDKLVKLQSAPEEGVGEVREEVRRICEVYRRGQVEVLEAGMDRLADRIERLEGILDEVMG